MTSYNSENMKHVTQIIHKNIGEKHKYFQQNSWTQQFQVT